jgi:hypothetical protein
LPDITGSQPGHVRASPIPWVNRAYPSSEPGSSKVYRTCPTPRPNMSGLAQSSQWLSPSQTYPAKQPSSSMVSRIYPNPGSDMSSLLTLTQVRPRHHTCLVPRPGSRDDCRTCLGLWHPNGQIPSGSYKRPPHPPQLGWPLSTLVNTLKHSLLSSNLLSLKLHCNLSFLREI